VDTSDPGHAQCDFCGYEYPPTPEEASETARRNEVPRPEGLTVVELDRAEAVLHDGPARRTVIIVQRWEWATPLLILIGLTCIFVAVVVWGPRGSLATPAGYTYVGALSLGAIVYAAYGLLNRTSFSADDDAFTVRHGPLPWPGNRSLSARDIKRLYVRRVEGRTSKGNTVRFHLMATLVDGVDVDIDTFSRHNLAAFVAQRIERRLRTEITPGASHRA
jgi:hypothetical protein